MVRAGRELIAPGAALPDLHIGSAIDLISHTESDDVRAIVDGLLAVG